MEETLPKAMVTSYATRISVINIAVAGTMASGICDSLDVLVVQATAAHIRKPRKEATDLSFPAPNE